MFVEVRPDSFESIIIAWMHDNFPELSADPVIGGVDFWTKNCFLVHVSPQMHIIKYNLSEMCSFKRIDANVADPTYFVTLKELITSQLKRMCLR